MPTVLRFKFPLAWLALAALCQIAYHAIGSRLDENGILHEAFGFIPLSLVFLLLAIVSAVFAGIRIYRRKG